MITSILIKMKQNFNGHALPSKGKRKRETEKRFIQILMKNKFSF
jgi:hypothetical protein